MKYRILGRTGFRVSEIGFGCWAIGGTGYGPTSDQESLDALEAAWERGVNFYDTADSYGEGHSEDLLGGFLKSKPRDQICVATKGGWDFYHEGGTRKNFSPDYIRFACESSLKRLGLSCIDLYQLHNPSLDIIRSGEVLNELENLKKEGKIRAIGLSVHTEEEVEAVLRDGRADTLQLAFNLLDQQMSERAFDLAKRHDVGVIIREPLAFGFLTDKYRADHSFHKTDHRRRFGRELIENNLKKVDMLKTVLTSKRLSLAKASLEFILQFDQVSAVIPGAKTVAQVLENTEASSHPMLRSEEAYHLREMYYREGIFRRDLL